MTKKEKRANGEGSVYQTKDGRWRAELNWIDKNGKMKRKCFSSKKQSEAKRKLSDFRKKLLISDGDNNFDDAVFKDYADYWVNQILKPKIKELSYKRKVSTLHNQVYPYIGEYKIRSLTFSDIQKMVNSLNTEGLSYSTIKKAYEAVSACLRFYRIENGCSFNPCEGISLPENKRKEVSDILFYDKTQREIIMREATKTNDCGNAVYNLGWAVALLMYSGMRVGELCALEWSDVDFANKTISISKTAVERTNGGVITQNSTKTVNGIRKIPITETAFIALKEIYKVSGKEKHVMTSVNHKRVRPTYLDKVFYRILCSVGLPKAGVHTLRHTFASMLFNNGCEIKIVSELLGHSSTKVTENIYIHLIQEQKIKAIQNIDKFSD